jgi:hypothetical protein
VPVLAIMPVVVWVGAVAVVVVGSNDLDGHDDENDGSDGVITVMDDIDHRNSNNDSTTEERIHPIFMIMILNLLLKLLSSTRLKRFRPPW